MEAHAGAGDEGIYKKKKKALKIFAEFGSLLRLTSSFCEQV